MSDVDSDNRYHDDNEAERPQAFGEDTEKAQYISRIAAELKMPIGGRLKDRLGTIAFRHGLPLLVATGVAYFAILPQFGQGAAQVSIPKFIIEPMPIPMVRGVSDQDQEAINQISSRYSNVSTEMWSQKESEASVSPTSATSQGDHYTSITNEEFYVYPRERAELYARPTTSSNILAELKEGRLYRATRLVRQETNHGFFGWCELEREMPEGESAPVYLMCGVGISITSNSIFFADEKVGPLRSSFVSG